MPGKVVVVLGAGIGGLAASNHLRSKLGKEHQIILVDRSPVSYLGASLTWLAMGLRRPENISRDATKLAKRGVEFLQAEVMNIDVKARKITTQTGEIKFDYLIISLGAELAPQAIPGLKEEAHSFYSMHDASRLQSALNVFDGGKILLSIASVPFKCPAAPYEGVLMLDYILRRRGVRDRTEIAFTTPELCPLLLAGPVVSNRVQKMLLDREILYKPNQKLSSVDGSNKLVHYADGSQAKYDLLITVPPHKSPNVVVNSKLGNEAGWIAVNRTTLETKAENVYAIGDVTTVLLEAGMPLPKAGVFARGEGRQVAENLAAIINNKGKQTPYDARGGCYMETGYGKAAYVSGRFYTTPTPSVKLLGPSLTWHVGKVVFETKWKTGWF